MNRILNKSKAVTKPQTNGNKGMKNSIRKPWINFVKVIFAMSIAVCGIANADVVPNHVTASAYYSAQGATPERAIDGDLDLHWTPGQSCSNASPHYWQAEFSENVSLSKVKLYLSPGTQNFGIQVSNDGVTYTDIAALQPYEVADKAVPVEVTIDQQLSFKYLKVLAGDNDNWSSWFDLWEIEFISAVDIESGLIAHYTFDGNANDSAGTNHGTEHGGVSLTSDRFGNPNSAYQFDGVDDYITVPDTQELRLSNTDYTISLWFNDQHAEDAYKSGLIYKRDDSYADGYVFASTGVEDGNDIANVSFHLSQGGDPNIWSAQQFENNSWHHAVITYDISQQLGTIYVNGRLVESATLPAPNANTSSQLFIGKDSIANRYYIDGKLDDIRIYNRTLSLAEIQSLTNDIPEDPYADNVVLLMHMNGEDGSTDFVDEKGHSVTANGDAQISVNNDKFGGASAYFDGNGDYLTVQDGSDFAFGTGDFTVECWMNSASGSNSRITNRVQQTTGPGTWSLAWGGGNHVSFSEVVYGEPGALAEGLDLTNGWHHIAATRQSGVLRIFVDGNLEATNESFINNLDSTRDLVIGASLGELYFDGNIDELRITKGVARYTSNFTPATTEFDVGVDIKAGLLAHYTFDGNANDVSGNGNNGIVTGATLVADRFGNPESAYRFDGDDYIFVDTNDFSVTDSLSISAWVKNTDVEFSDNAGNLVYSKGFQGNSPWNDYNLKISNSQTMIFRVSDSQNVIHDTPESEVLAPNMYHHIVAVADKNLSKVYLYIDGNKVSETAYPAEIRNYNDFFYIGGWNDGSYGGNVHFWKGEIDDIRIYNRSLSIQEIQVLTNEIPEGSDANTVLLMHMNGEDGSTGFVDEKGHVVTPSGDAQISTSESKFGGASAYFDGADDSLMMNGSGLQLPTGDFTIEGWVKRSAVDNREQMLFVRGRGDSSWARFNVSHYIALTADNRILGSTFSNGNDIQRLAYSPPVLDTDWHHVAFQVRSGVLEMYFDGVLTDTDDSGYVSQNDDAFWKTYIGSAGPIWGKTFFGNLDEWRVTKGIARYTDNFTPQSKEFQSAIASSYEETILSHNPVGYWKLDETTGTTFSDSSGNGHHGTISGDYVLGKEGLVNGSSASIEFTGTVDSRIELPAEIRPSDAVSIIATVQNPGVDRGAVFASGINGSVWHGTYLMVSESSIRFVLNSDLNATYRLITEALYDFSDGAPRQIIATWDKVNSDAIPRIFIDGELVAEGSVWNRTIINNTHYAIGSFHRAGDYTGEPYTGLVDEVAIYHKGLTAQDAQQLFDASKIQTEDEHIKSARTISANDTSYDGKNIIVDGAVLTIDGLHNFKSLQLINGATLTHSIGAESGLELDVEGDLTIDSISGINVSGKGGSGTGIVSDEFAGGSYGGKGGLNSNDVYGVVKQPSYLGTGGGNNNSNRGGGAIKLNIAGELNIAEGAIIEANGSVDGDCNAGGSGGSIWIEVESIFGKGNIQANGADSNSGDCGNYGAGGGGRIAISYSQNNGFSHEQVQAYGGVASITDNSGQLGTKYIVDLSKIYIHEELGLIQDITSFNHEYFVTSSSVIYKSGSYGGDFVAVDGLGIGESANTIMATENWLYNSNHQGARRINAWGDIQSFVVKNHYYPGDISAVDNYIIVGESNGTGHGNAWRIYDKNTDFDSSNLGFVSDEQLRNVYSGQGQAAVRYLDTVYFYGTRGGTNGKPAIYSTTNTVLTSVSQNDLSLVDVGVDNINGATHINSNETSVIATMSLYNSYSYSLDNISWNPRIIPDAYIFANSCRVISINDKYYALIKHQLNQTYHIIEFADGGENYSIIADLATSEDFSGEVTDTSFLRIALLNGELVAVGSANVGGITYGIIQKPYIERSLAVLNIGISSFEKSAIEKLIVKFSTQVNEETISQNDISITDPSGQSVVISSINKLGLDEFEVILQQPAITNGTYTVNIGSDINSFGGGLMDQDGDGIPGEPVEDIYTTTFTIDTQKPAAPIITSHNAQLNPINVTTTSVELTGSREDNSAIIVNGQEKVALGSGDWSTTITLPQGSTDVTVLARDEAGNVSEESVVLHFFVDSIKPSVTPTIYFVTPSGSGDAPFAENYAFKESPNYIELKVTEAGSGIDLEQSDLELRLAGQIIATEKSIEGLGVRLVPLSPLIQGDYVLSGYISDAAGNQTNAFEAIFYVDMTPPDAPTIDQFPAIVTINQHTFTGTKTADAVVLVSGNTYGSFGATTWTATNVSLIEGDNQLSFQAEDKAGNLSEPTVITIKYDNTAPDAVTATGNGDGVGTHVVLDWSGYDEVANGNDIKEYKVYQSATAFTDIASATQIATVPSGTKTYTVQGLNRDQTYHYAVVAFDSVDQHIEQVTSIAVTTEDTQKPADISNPVVTTTGDSVTASWKASASDDVAGYKVYFANEDVLETNALTFNKGSLAAATEYSIKVTTVDASGNESTGVSFSAVTFLANPAGLTPNPLNGMVELSWNAAAPVNLVKEYAIYQSDTVITDVSAMTPVAKVTSPNTTGKVAGLENGTTYHFAVTTINKTGGEDKAVTSITATPEADEQGPTLSNLKYANVAITNGSILSTNGKLSIEAQDPSSVAFVKMQIDDGIIKAASASASGDVYSIDIDLFELTDGAHTITITAEDTLGNATEPAYTVNVTVTLAAPSAPAITSPNSGYKTNAESITVTGTAPANTQVQLFNNDQLIGDKLALDPQNRFTTTVDLVSGANELKATAEYQDRAAPSAYSSVVSVEMDDTIPQTPTALSAEGYKFSRIELSWLKVNDESVDGYNIYRSLAPITEIGALTPINAELITETYYTDVPVEDGKYYYVVTSQNDTGTNSLISNQASAVADSTPPHAVSISYAPQGEFDGTGDILRIAPGDVAITVEVSESLYVTPFMSIAYEGAGVTAIELTQQSDLVYTGTYTVTENTPSGNAYALLSMKDALKNPGNEIDAGEFIIIDAQGPQVNAITVTPGHPIKTDSEDPTEVTVALELSEALPQDQMPQLSFKLSGAGRLDTSLDVITKIDELNYSATFILPADAGVLEPQNPQPETISFSFSAIDDLGNTSETIKGSNRFLVYQGDLPPLSAPLGLSAIPKAEGNIKLTWFEVDEAAEYAIFQKAEGEAEFTEIARTAELEYIATTQVDGEYQYGVKSIRSENSEETASSMSEIVSIDSDSTPPQPPTNLALQLQSKGMAVMWEDSESTNVYYRVYRADSTNILDVTIDGVEQLIDTPIYSTAYLDPHPTSQAAGYVVTAVDDAGNESAPSATAYNNEDLLPVSTLEVLVEEGQNPVVSWTHTSDTIAGYNLYLNGSETAQNEQLLNELNFEDTGYTGAQRQYTLKAQDDNQQQSLGRSIILPNISVELAEGVAIKRGIMNAVDYIVTNNSDFEVKDLSLNIDLNGAYQQDTAKDSIAAGETKTITAVIGGYKDLPDLTTLITSLIIEPNAGEKVTIKISDEVLVTESALLLTMETQELTRNATGKVRFTLENTSDVQIEVKTATGSGRFVSDEISFKLVDDEDNELIIQGFKQTTGDVITIGSDTVARIPAGESFTSEWFDMTIPAAAPDQAKLVLDLKQIHYNLGDDGHAQIAGKQIYSTVNLVDTAYYGELISIQAGEPVEQGEPVISYGDEDITITGQAVNRETQAPMVNTPLIVIIKTNTYEKRIDVTTNAEGIFEYKYTPTAGESGIYKVSVIHPDMIERPEHGQFAIGGLFVSPGTYTLRIPNNYQHIMPVKLIAGSGSGISGIHIEYQSIDQPGGEFAVGMSAELPAQPINLTAGQTLETGILITATEQAEKLGKMVFKVYADNISEDPVSTIIVDYQLSDAIPTLHYSPSVIETGVFKGQSRTHSVTLGNRGFATLEDVNLSIVEISEQGTETLAPDWFHITTGKQVGDIEIAQQQEVQIMITPPPTQQIGLEVYNLRIDSSNHPVRYVPIYAMIVDENAVGSVIFKVEDIYTGTLDDTGNRIEGLAGAVIYLEHEQDPMINISVKTGVNGEVDITELQAGPYRYYITAPDHQELRGRIRIEPGQTALERIFLDNTLIIVEWSVTEITLEDRYEINLKATYETDVPTAVVVMEPMSFNLPRMNAGEIFNAEVKVTNHGLIQAENMQFTLPADTEFLKYELLIDPNDIPQILEAKSFTRIPFRVIQLKPFEPQGDEGTGAGCGSYSSSMKTDYSSICANDNVTNRSAASGVYYSWGPCSDPIERREIEGGKDWIYDFGGDSGPDFVEGARSGGGGLLIYGFGACSKAPESRDCQAMGNGRGM